MSAVHFVKYVGRTPAEGAAAPTAAEVYNVLADWQMDISEVHISVEGDTVFLAGRISSRENLENAVVTAGYFTGIATVDITMLAIKQENNCTGHAADGHIAYYAVKKGDSLRTIAEKVYGVEHSHYSSLIFAVNQPVLAGPERICHGQVLRIPLLPD